MFQPAFVFLFFLAAAAAHWQHDLFRIVGTVVVAVLVLVAGVCCVDSPRLFLFGLLQSAADLVARPPPVFIRAEAPGAEAKKIESQRGQMSGLEEQLCRTEARVRVSETTREKEKKRHGKEVQYLDAQLADLSRGIKEALFAKDQVIVECRQWRRKFENLEDLQQQALEFPPRGVQGRPRWAPATKNGVVKGGRIRPAKKFTAIAQVGLVNAAWESKLASYENEARDYVARITDQLGSLTAAATALSVENTYLHQQIQARPDALQKLAQQQLQDAVGRTEALANQLHGERVAALQQTHLEELMAVKVEYEKKLVKATAEIKAEGSAVTQQRQVAESAAQEVNSLKLALAAKEAQLVDLQASNAKIAGDLQVTKEETAKLGQILAEETAEVAKLVQESDGLKTAGKSLRLKYDQLKSEKKTLAREKERLQMDVRDLENALDDLAGEKEKLEEDIDQLEGEVEKREGDNQVLLEHNEELFLNSVAANIEHQQARDRVGNLERQVADLETSDITQAVYVPLVIHAPPMNPSPYRSFAARPLMLSLAKLLLVAVLQVPFTTAAPLFSPLFLSSRDTEPGKEPSDPSLWIYLGFSAALVLSGGAFAGLTIALMGQDEVYLQVIKTSGEEHERKNAASVLNLLNHGKHWVLVTLLLSNVITNETLPIVLDRTLGGGWPAVLGSTALIVIFGEIVPQSICVRYGLPIGAWMAPCVLVLMYIMSPVAWPIAKLLDRLLGEDHGTIYKKAGLKTLVTLHKTLGEAGEQLNSDEVTIISAVLDLKEKSVGSIMTPMDDVFTMSADTVLDERTMDHILSQGYSRIPIHSPDNPMNFVGMLLVKMLITYDPEDCKRVREFALATLPETRPETSCLDIVNFFQEGKSHMVLVSEYPSEDRGALGVVTLEDVIEELIGEEIIDESDVFIDVHKAIRRMTPAPKSRVAKGKIVEEPPLNASVVTDGDLVDVDSTRPSSLPKPSDLIRRRSSVESPLSRFQLRKTNTDINPDSANEWVTQVGTTEEIREHLKHLGPSNLASRPRQTRYHAVKIKRNSNSPSRSAQTDFESGQSTSDSQKLIPSFTAYQGGIGAGLLNSAGPDAKDGAHALKIGYGTMSSHDSVSKGTGAQQYKDLPQVSIPEAVREEHEDQPRSGSTRKASSDEGSVESSDTPGFIYHHRGPARSGSITEQIVDVNGIRKVVLHANCSSSSEGESHPPGRHRDQHHAEGAVLDTDDGKSENPDSGHTKSKKKRRRKKHGKGSKADDGGPSEDQPLLK
ncbi:uncharacterized protein N7479_006824 [Penicillium vulpinum]|uniref:uncharacterized protein n=1 Tax=Penicillium vulpinum TaxID=29845 RepID=UPI0025465E3A|nr:uncharacterized protein N7479_006824 [Penicillium vulpinum]KAJ5959674.1 hypothetical protein N7479_006824 [Penicillium vulpinum]